MWVNFHTNLSISDFQYQGQYPNYDALSLKTFRKELRANPRQNNILND